MNVTLWGIGWHWWIIAMFFVSAFAHKLKIAKYGVWLAAALGLLAGWTVGWGVGAMRYEYLMSIDPKHWVEYGIAIKGVTAILAALLIAVGVLFLSAPNKDGTADV